MGDALSSALLTSEFIGGDAVTQFEGSWASYCGAAQSVATSSGTSALQMTLEALGIGKGDEVLIPANTFFGAVAAVLRSGAVPVYCDVVARTLLIDLDDAESKITSRTRAMIVVHLFGNVCDMDSASALATKHELLVIEDAAQAHGATWRDGRSGSFGFPACYSFYPGKNLGALGDAGGVVADDVDLIARVRSLGDHGRDAACRHLHTAIGANERMDALQAAFLSLKLLRLDAWNNRRRQIVAQYLEALPLGDVEPVWEESGSRSCFHQFVVRVQRRDTVLGRLRVHGIAAGVHYPVPCHLQPASKAILDVPSLPVVERASREILSLPCDPSLSDADVERVAEIVSRAVLRKDEA
jgi:dTDP-4-amino-4,6-dideoxygalactose transaminase